MLLMMKEGAKGNQGGYTIGLKQLTVLDNHIHISGNYLPCIDGLNNEAMTQKSL